MIFRNVIFQLEVIKQRLPAGLVSHHEQASKRNREQQHRVLWPAYNPNLATRQASTEGLFQQTQAVSTQNPGKGSMSAIEIFRRLLVRRFLVIGPDHSAGVLPGNAIMWHHVARRG